MTPTRRKAPSDMASRPADAGFILVETIVTLAISAFLLVALTTLISFVAQSFNRTAASGNDLEIRSRFLASIARDLSLAERATFAGDKIRFAFRGTSTRLLFTERFADSNGMEGLRLVELGGDGRPTRREGELAPDATDFAAVAFRAPTAPFVGALRLRFAYFGQTASGVETLTDDWLEDDRMPVAIRVSLLDGNGRPATPSLRVPLMINAEPGCASPVETNCSYAQALAEPSASAEPDPSAPRIDPNDSQGWLRYGR